MYKLFSHMLDQVPFRHRTRSAQIFRLQKAIQGPSHLSDSEIRSLTALGLSFAFSSTENDLSSADKALSAEEAQERVEDVDVLLKTHCAGLLGLRRSDPLSPARYNHFGQYYELDAPVKYIHRTAADFLMEQDIWSRILMRSEGFDEISLLLPSWALQLTRIALYGANHSNMLKYQSMFRGFLHLLRCADESSDGSSSVVLKRVDSVFAAALKPWIGTNYWSDVFQVDYPRETETDYADNLLSFAVRAGLRNFVEKEINEFGSSVIIKKGRPLLDYISHPEPAYRMRHNRIDPCLVSLLLAHGANPNEKFHGWSVLQNCLRKFYRGYLILDNGFKIISMLISHGGDPNAFIEYGEKYGSIPIVHRSSAIGVLKQVGLTASDHVTKMEYQDLIRYLETRKGKDRHWIYIDDGEFELQNANSDDALIWHDVNGEFVPKQNERKGNKKRGTLFDRLKQRASRRSSKTS